MSPRKSSTSSGRRSDAPRPRYLGLEVAGEHLPPLSSRGWDALLRRRVPSASEEIAFRIIRSDSRRAIVEVGHRTLADARAAWNGPGDDGVVLSTVRTWGTLVGAKRWLATGGRAT